MFDRINTDKRVKAEPRLREVRLLSQSVSRHFIKLATDNRLLLVEALFSRNRQAQALVQSDYVDPAERRQEKKQKLKAEEDARQKARDARREATGQPDKTLKSIEIISLSAKRPKQ